MAEAFLFNLGLGVVQDPNATAGNKRSCATPEELQDRLRAELQTKLTPKRAEHVSTTCDLISTALLTLHVPEPEYDALHAVLGGARPPLIDGMVERTVRAAETLANQPQDDPIAQRAVAKHIVGAIANVDGSTWGVREVSRGAQGWTFLYQCKDSLQFWQRLHAKNPSRSVIGEYSQKVDDPVNYGRPAFDCRGSISIAFIKNTRLINVKYEHTPIHKTVFQLFEYFKPPPSEPSRAPPAPQKTPKPKSKKRDRETANDNEEHGDPSASAKKKRQPKKADDGSTPAKKRRKKSKDGNPPPDSLLDNLDAPDAQPVGSSSHALYGVGSSASAAEGSSYPQGLVGDQPSVPTSVVVNVSAEEAARRRDVATKMLSDAGVDPATLSTEQFNIFANQSPELQKESLSMLVKYGAVRLRIVHPNRDATQSPATTSPPTQAPVTATEPTSTATPSKTASEKKRASKGAKGNATVPQVESDAAETPTAKSRKQQGRPPRLYKCDSCAKRRRPCDKMRPACGTCKAAGRECVYAVRKGSKRQSNAQEEPQAELERDDTPDLDSLQYATDIADGDMSSMQVDSNHYYQQESGGLAYPQVLDDLAQQAVSSAAGHSFPATQAQDLEGSLANNDYSYPEPESTQTATAVYPPAMTETPRTQSRGRKDPKGRTALPSGSQADETRNALPTQTSLQSPVWPPTVEAQTNTDSINMGNTSSTPLRQSRSRKSQQMATVDTHQLYDGLDGAAALSQAAIRQTQNSPAPTAVVQNTVAMGSPYQTAAANPRTKSAQGHRTQSRTPAPDKPSPRLQKPSSAQQPAQQHASSTSNTWSGLGYNAYSAGYSSTSNDQASTKSAGYDAYSNSATSQSAPSYQSFDSGYNSRSTASAVSMSMSSAQTVAGTPTNNSNQWSSSTTQTRSKQQPQSYGATGSQLAAATGATYNQRSTGDQSSLNSFSVRPPVSNTRASTSSNACYGQQHNQGYGNSYSSSTQQPAAASTAAQDSHHHQSQQQTQHNGNNQNWYGFGSNSNSFTAANNYGQNGSTNGGYGAGGSGTSGGSYHAQGEHGSVGLGGHHGGFGAAGGRMDSGDEVLYDLLQNTMSSSSR